MLGRGRLMLRCRGIEDGVNGLLGGEHRGALTRLITRFPTRIEVVCRCEEIPTIHCLPLF